MHYYLCNVPNVTTLSDSTTTDMENDMNTIQTANFEIGFHEPEDNDNQYGWFEHNEYGDEYGGSLWFKGKELVDYDGISGYLPKEVLDALEAIGFDVNEMRPTGE
jgi:hypothetical protein